MLCLYVNYTCKHCQNYLTFCRVQLSYRTKTIVHMIFGQRQYTISLLQDFELLTFSPTQNQL
jgi:hypothetical protein